MELKIDRGSSTPKYRQIADSLTGLIESGALRVGDKLPSIDTVSRNTGIAKQTVVQAYSHLQSDGIIQSANKKGFYVQTNVTGKQWRVLVLFNVMSPSKELIYKGITDALGEKAHVELFFHNYNFEMFGNIIRSKAGQFHYFIVMPHDHPDTGEVLRLLPPEKLIIIDTPLPRPIEGASSIHQQFKADVCETLLAQKQRLIKYRRIVLLAEEGKRLSDAIFAGIKAFATWHGLSVTRADVMQRRLLRPGTLFITMTDDQLIACLEARQEAGLKLGKDIGILSYNENPLKRILSGGIATISTDFAQMGRTAAACILDKKTRVVHNPFSLIVRKSL